VAPFARGGESKNREAPVLNMASIGKCCLKKSPGKIRILGPFGFRMPDTGSNTVFMTTAKFKMHYTI
jgi:hypothetical protein